MVRVTFRDTIFHIHGALTQQWPQSVLSNIRKTVPPYTPRPRACMWLNAGCETVSGRDDVIVEKFHQVYFYAPGQRSADAMKLCRRKMCVCMCVRVCVCSSFLKSRICFNYFSCFQKFSSTCFIFSPMLHMLLMQPLFTLPNNSLQF